MDSLRKVEEDLRNISAEFRKKYPEVLDATERALTTLKTMREMYVADKMRKSGSEKEEVKIPQSSDILAPYLLACNYADANPKLLLMALNGIQLLVNYEMVPPSDVKNVLRVFSIQAGAGKPELQLKILQVLLHLANWLTSTDALAHHLNDATLRTFFTITLSLCEARSNMSVSTTAQATIRQLISVIMEPLVSASTAPASSSNEVKSNYTSSALCLVNDFALFFQGKDGEWCRGVDVPQAAAFDLLDYTMGEWSGVFLNVPAFRAWVKEVVFPAMKHLMRDLQDNYKQMVMKEGVAVASMLCSRVVRLARSFLLNFSLPDFLDEVDITITFMVHTLTSDFDFDGGMSPSGRSSTTSNDSYDEKEFQPEPASSSGGMMGGASALFGGLTRFQFGGNKEKQAPPTGNAALHGTYLPLKRSASATTASSEVSSPNTRPSCRLLIHPAGACLEALLSFFLSDNIRLVESGKGREVVTAAMINTIASATTVLSQALLVENNVKVFVEAISESKIMTLVEGVMSNKEADPNVVMRAIHDNAMSSPTVTGADLLILSFCVVQVIVRHLVEFTLEGINDNKTATGTSFSTGSNGAVVFLDDFKVMRRSNDAATAKMLREVARKVAESIYENIQEACAASLSHVHYPLLVRRSVGVMSEMALVTGLLRLIRPCEVIISSMCQFTVPRWHGHEYGHGGGIQVKDAAELETLRWAHIQAIVRLTQTVHVLADVVSDWDIIVDAFEQITDCILNPKTVLADDVTSTEIDKVFMSLERFKGYTVFLSDESLIKLTTSLVAVSLNNLAVMAKSSSMGSLLVNQRNGESVVLPLVVKNKPRRAPAYMIDGIAAGLVSFSLQATVEVAKNNMHRISRVWQMVISHLKMVASLKSQGVRSVAVASTHDLIASALKQFHKPTMVMPEALDNSSKLRVRTDNSANWGACLSDEALFTNVIPSFETVFMAHKCHIAVISARSDKPGSGTVAGVELSQADLFSSLRSLTVLRFDDVKVGIMQGLLNLLQGGCEVLSENGWAAVISLIADVPTSLISDISDYGAVEDGGEETQKWPVAGLAIAFNCMKLILDEYMDLLSLVSTNSTIGCLAAFSSQLLDVNISLTSLELLWKVYDHTMRGSSDKGSSEKDKQEVFNVTTKQLLVLSMDTRPEIRHCAMNTLFTALTMTANASLTSGGQWKQIFDDVVFPLFERAGARSTQAMQSQEEANAPELKKGTKIVLHHTRDTAHKQWSETRVLALRGLTRVVKTCALLLIQETWFKSTWATALEICKNATHDASGELEVALASFDVMFAMLKIVSEASFKDMNMKTDAKTAEGIEGCRRDMWASTWSAVTAAAKYNGQCSDLALHVCQNIMSIYESSANQEFKQSQNFRNVCETIVTLARPRTPRQGSSGDQPNKVIDMQLNRTLLEFLKLLPVNSVESATLVASALAELSFANQYVQMPSPITGENIYMGPCLQKFREDVADNLMKCFLPACAKINDRSRSWGTAVADTVFRRFINDVCGSAISSRSISLNNSAVTPHKKKISPVSATGTGTLETSATSPTTARRTISGSRGHSNHSSPASKELGFFSFLTGATNVDSSSDEKERVELEIDLLHEDEEEQDRQEQEQDQDFDDDEEEEESSTPTVTDPSFHVLKQRAIPSKDENRTWTAFYPLTAEIHVLATTLEHCISTDNFNVLSEPTKENVFSSLLCLMSPWRMSELPGANTSQGNFVSAVHPMLASQMTILNAIHKLAVSHPESNWLAALISTVVDAMKLQILAIADSDQEQANTAEEVRSILDVWKRICEILTHTAANSKGATSRKCSVESLLILAKDLSYGVLDNRKCKHSKQIIQEGCIMFLRSLLQLETQLDDIPRSFNARRTTEKESLESWFASMMNPPLELMQRTKVDENEETNRFNKTGHLLIYLPIAFQLHQCGCEEIKDIIVIITSSVDIAALLNSYTSLQAKIDHLEGKTRK